MTGGSAVVVVLVGGRSSTATIAANVCTTQKAAGFAVSASGRYIGVRGPCKPGSNKGTVQGRVIFRLV